MEQLKRVLVTGAVGYLGSHLIPALVADGFEVTGIDRVSPADAPDDWTFIQCDLSDPAQVKESIRGAELIVHVASIHPWKQYTDDQYIDANIKGTWHLYSAAAEREIDRIVLTSSIAASGYGFSPKDWPVDESRQGVFGDIYSLTKHTQETIAKSFASQGKIRTITLRPPAFMPKPDQEIGFSLTGSYAVVDDMVRAHHAAVRVMAGRQGTDVQLQPFEAIFVTTRLPYQPQDAGLRDRDDFSSLRMVERHWPHAAEWMRDNGFEGAWTAAVYDLGKAKRLLGWEPQFNFEQWFATQEQ